MRKVLCANSKYDRVFAHVLDNGTIDIQRQDQTFTIIPNADGFILIGTNPQGRGKTTLIVKGGKLVEETVKFKEDKPNGSENTNDNGQEREEENNQLGGDDPDGSAGGTGSANSSSESGTGEGDDPITPATSRIDTERKHTRKLEPAERG